MSAPFTPGDRVRIIDTWYGMIGKRQIGALGTIADVHAMGSWVCEVSLLLDGERRRRPLGLMVAIHCLERIAP